MPVNPNFGNYADKEKTLAAEIEAAEKAEQQKEAGFPILVGLASVPAAVIGDAMAQFKVSEDVTGHVANDGETVMQPLAGKTSKEIFEAHNVNVDAAEPGQYCQCRDCQIYLAGHHA